MLQNDDPEVSRWAVLAFGEIANRESVKILIALRKSRNLELRAAAYEAFYEMDERIGSENMTRLLPLRMRIIRKCSSLRGKWSGLAEEWSGLDGSDRAVLIGASIFVAVIIAFVIKQIREMTF